MNDSRLDELILTPAISNPGERAAVYRSAGRGDLVRIVRGAYLPSRVWESLSIEGRHLARMSATTRLHPETVFSHLSAALLWGLPIVGGDLRLLHSLAEPSSGGRSVAGVARHGLGIPRDVQEIDGIRVTSLPLTLVHLASGFRPEVSVPALDAAFGDPRFEVSRERLVAEAAELPSSRGCVRAVWAIEFADPASGSPGESLSRVGIHRLGLPRPVLQVRFVDARGFIGIVDFWWPDANVIGEFDGVGKYLREAFAVGADPAEVVLAEKDRENRLRALGPRVARWDWAVARSLPELRRRLSEAGLRAA